MILVSCNKQENIEKDSSFQSSQDSTKKSELDVSFLDNVIKDELLIDYKDIEKQTPKLQKLVKECLDAYKIKSISRFSLARPTPNDTPFGEKIKFTMSLQEEKKNRFDEIYYVNSECEWYGNEYKLVKKKTPEEIAKQFEGKMKLSN